MDLFRCIFLQSFCPPVPFAAKVLHLILQPNGEESELAVQQFLCQEFLFLRGKTNLDAEIDTSLSVYHMLSLSKTT